MYTTNREELIEIIKQEVQQRSSVPLDLSPNSNISRFIDIISITDDNLLFYISLLFNEINLETAILPSTIQNFCKLTGINYNTAVPASIIAAGYVELKNISKPLQVIVPENSNFVSSSGINFTTNASYYVYYNPSSLTPTVYKNENNKYIPVKSHIEAQDGSYFIVFEIDLLQIVTKVINFNTDTNTLSYTVRKPKSYFTYKTYVTVNGQKIPESYSIYTLNDTQYSYTIIESDETLEFIFATDVTGIPIPEGSELEIKIQYTQGSKGNILSNSLKSNITITDEHTNTLVNFYLQHPNVISGRDPDNILHLKKELHNYFLSRNSIIARYPDLQMIGKYLEPVSKYSKVSLNMSISPELTVFSDLHLEDEVLETTTCTFRGVIPELLSHQGFIATLGSRVPNEIYFSDSTLLFPEHVESDMSVICPFFLQKDDVFNKIHYYYRYYNVVLGMTNIIFSKISLIDNITTIGVSSIEAGFDNSMDVYTVQIELLVSTPDIDEFSNHFDGKFELRNESDALIAEITSFVHEISDNQVLKVKFNVPAVNITPDDVYKMYIRLMFHNEVLFYGETKLVVLFNKLQTFSRFKVNGYYNKISEFSSDDPSLTGTLFFFNYNSTKNDIRMRIKSTNTDLSNVQSVKLQTENVDGNISYYECDIDFKNSTSLRISTTSYQDISLLVSVSATLVFSDHSEVTLQATNLTLSNDSYKLIDIYHVPVLSLRSYQKLVENNLEDLPANTINAIYEKLRDKLVFGTISNIKFLRTKGTLENIKYNKQILYPEELVNKYTLPLVIQISLIVSVDFDNSVVQSIKKQIADTLTPDVLQSGFSKKMIFDILSQYDTIKSIDILKPEKDLLYDFSDEQILYNSLEYTPELMLIKPENILIDYKIHGTI